MNLLKIIAGVLLIIILCLIAVLHFYWAAGGKALSDGVFPDIENSKFFGSGPVPRIPPLPTIIVGLGLLAMAAIVASNLGWMNFGEWSVWTRRGLWVISIIFLARAIGEFRYVGFFKTRKDSLFAKKDSKYYSPLCLVMSGLGFLILVL